ncbi:Predicted nucleic acid-binding protein,contains PIN domain [Desulfamplus magnetovallimortis]|uniref:Predicted nucleic acid-binding protein,contains PIN domain n=1 Tax=Desulfamplus magnetovallimortis TaxID=1246637 RepID=A0A1W1HI29_9BACT|nr:type II toxin-antitoxin system VapC family toxin [Desulfamplus magnetovallimortis]SLM32028.1 Predicted nucleic acid-binding protein,contains PIN domain [Desulfamplus magnetovallimortis]
MIVVDTNIISYLYLPTKYSNLAEQLLKQEPQWAAPVLWKSEFRNVLSGYLRKELYEFDSIIAILQEAEDLMSNQEYQISSLQVMNLVSKSDCSAYDCEFVALAEHLKIKLVTQDKKILQNFPQISHSLESYLALEV